MKNKSIEYVRKTLGLSEDEKLHLEHWLRVLGDEGHHVTVGVWIPHGYCIQVVKAITRDETLIKLNLTTGQPATEADYQAIAEILNIEL